MRQTDQNVLVRIIGSVALAFLVSGCAALAPGVEGAASLAGTAGTTATGYMSTQSSRELNAANVELILAQARMQKMQAEDLHIKREELESERAATVGILREMAVSREDPTLADLALWVQAGGDADYAIHYALQGPAKTTSKQQ
ncbi:MAG: hypothetical protein WCA22_04950 [Candidatus Binatus sp.]